MNTTDIKMTWNGSQWDCSAAGPQSTLPPGTTIHLRIPAADGAMAAVGQTSDKILIQKAGTTSLSGGVGPLMLPKDTCVYLPIAPSSKDKGAWELWDEHQRQQKPKLARKPAKALVPILLLEDLHLLGEGRIELADCRCTIGEREFKSLNEAGSHAHSQWSNRINNTLSVFREIRYVRNKQLTLLMDLREHVMEGTPFRDETGEDEGPELFDTSSM
jgi:hypothetical protein